MSTSTQQAIAGRAAGTIYRQATREELDLAISWAVTEGWNPGLADAPAFWAADPSGYVVAERHGEVVATCSIVSYEGFGFIGFFIVRPDLRGQGIGGTFWEWLCKLHRERLGQDAAIGLDGVFDVQPFYAKSGFQFSHRNLRMQGVGCACPSVSDIELVPLSDLVFEDVSQYDQRHFGYDRKPFLQLWICPEGGLALGSLKHGQLNGMGTVRPCHNGFKIGPLFADDAATADQIFRALSNHAAGAIIFLDVPENSPAALALAQHELTEVFGWGDNTGQPRRICATWHESCKTGIRMQSLRN